MEHAGKGHISIEAGKITGFVPQPGGGRLIVVSSPSGGGKSSVIRRFLETHPNMIHSISCTTRPTRPEARDRGDYHFIDKPIFEKWIAEDKFVEWAEVHNNLYGTLKEPLQKALDSGTDVLLDLDVVGGTNVKKIFGKRAVTIFILPPSIDELKKRLDDRGTDSEKVKTLRLQNALRELKYKDDYDYRVINDDLDEACLEIERILFKEGREGDI